MVNTGQVYTHLRAMVGFVLVLMTIPVVSAQETFEGRARIVGQVTDFETTRISHMEDGSLDDRSGFNTMNRGRSWSRTLKQRGIQWVKRKRPRYAWILTEV